jgi:Methyltransferase domain
VIRLDEDARNRMMRAVGQQAAMADLVRPLKRPFRLTYRSSRPFIPDRIDFGNFLNQRRLLGCGVEIGVQEGKFSELLLDTWRGRHLISVDPWQEAPATEYLDIANIVQAEQDRLYRETVDRLGRFGSRSTIWRVTGEEAAKRVPHHSLDFVYLDARHDYASVMQDLEDWIEKVRPGGVLGGHDYVDGDLPAGLFGVRSAVAEFFGARRLRAHATFADPPWLSWFVVLPTS